MSSFSLTALLADIHQQQVYPATITVEKNKIVSIRKASEEAIDTPGYMLPGFIDSHVHIESSMLVPAEFARLAVVHGTVGTISDPHEIANVCGMQGVEFMIENGKTVPFKFNFGAPSCVPATIFETAGATLDAEDVTRLLERDDIKYLSEMMNFPGVLNKDKEVMKKIAAAHRLSKPVDGHAPGLRGQQALDYISAGISTDHECFTAEEALDKLKGGMKILIREGSAAKNFEALVDLLHDHSNMMMFCSDDKHPDSLVLGHINDLAARAVAKGIPLFNVLKAACYNPVIHYKLNVGLLRENDRADFIIVEDLASFKVSATYIDGVKVAEKGHSLISSSSNEQESVNQFNCSEKTAKDFAFPVAQASGIPVIKALDGQLITEAIHPTIKTEDGYYVSDVLNDVLKIAVVNRYRDAPVAIGFIKNIGLKRGAIASSVAHDSHNIVVVGIDDESIAEAVNLVIREQGGVSLYTAESPSQKKQEMILPLPVAGLMSMKDGYQVAEDYGAIDAASKALGSKLGSPYMTLSFMALLVIPHLKMSDLGLFDGDRFSFVYKS